MDAEDDVHFVQRKGSKRGEFEVRVKTPAGKLVTLHSGLKLGPPRRLKWPDHEEIVPKIVAALRDDA